MYIISAIFEKIDVTKSNSWEQGKRISWNQSEAKKLMRTLLRDTSFFHKVKI
jgi:hypothetical protein